MTDDSKRDSESPALRELLNKMHGNEPSVFEDMQSDRLEELLQQESPQSASPAEAPEETPALPPRERLQQESPQSASPAEAPEETPALLPRERPQQESQQSASPKQVLDNEPHWAPNTEEITQIKSKTPVMEKATDMTLDLSQASLQVEPTYVESPEIIRKNLELLPVTLECCLRSIPKTLGEVSNIVVGEIVQLGCGLDCPIELKANGRTFAIGRLVMVDGQLAIEVIEKRES